MNVVSVIIITALALVLAYLAYRVGYKQRNLSVTKAIPKIGASVKIDKTRISLMALDSHSSRLKVEWAEKHILELYLMFRNFSETDFYTISVEENPEKRTQSLRVDMNLAALNFETSALIIGDALHNLRSALDHLYYEVVLTCGGKPSNWTRFPISDSREGLETNFIKSALKQKQITAAVADFILNTIKPYEAGNLALWGLHQLNILDKHEVIVPVLKLVGFFGVRLEDENGQMVGATDYIADESCTIPISGTYGKKIKLKNKGRASTNVIFDVGASIFAGQTVYPSLKWVAEEVTRTIKAFEILLA